MDNDKTPWLQRPIHAALPAVTNEIAIFAGIILLAFVTRFYDLGTRVMSHDESLHTYFSWLLYRGQGYQHTPMMHGPYQFHIIALTYFLFGVVYTTPENYPMTVQLNNIVNSVQGVKEYNVNMAATLLTGLVPLVVYFASGKLFVRGIAAGAVKG